jgi:replicative DNA helicase
VTTPLHNAPMERTYAATVLALPDLLASHRVSPDDIVDADARAIVRAVTSLLNAGARVTPNAARSWLVTYAGYADPAAVPTDLGDIEPDLGPIAEGLRTMAQRRRLVTLSQRVTSSLQGGHMDAAHAALAELSLEWRGSSDAQVFNLRALMEYSLKAIQAEAGTKGALIRAGQPSLDDAYQMSPGALLTLGAQTNVGKSTLIMTWLFDMASRGIPVGLVSVEDPAEDWGVKAIGALAGINPSSIWGNKLDGHTVARIGDAMSSAADYPLAFSYVADRSLDGVLGRMEHLATHLGARVIAVDYLQAISHRPGKDIRQRIDATLEELIAQAGRLGVSLILASQLARPDKGNAFREPNMIDLKESGSIENRSQCVVLLWREKDEPGQPTLGKIAKAKRQPAGARFTLVRQPGTGLLRELSQRNDEPPDAF